MWAKHAVEAAEILPRLTACIDAIEKVEAAVYSMETQTNSELKIAGYTPQPGILDKITWMEARDVVARTLRRREAEMRKRLSELGVGASPEDLADVHVDGDVRDEFKPSPFGK